MPSEINLSLSGNKTGFSEKIKASTMNQICPPAAKEEEFLLEDVEQKTKAKSIKKLPIRAPRILCKYRAPLLSSNRFIHIPH